MEEEHGGDGDSASAAEVSNTEATGWWWPIGSMETSTENGKLFASGEPALGASHVDCVGANGGAKWGIDVGAHSHSSNIGLDVGNNIISGKYYVISIGKGTVKTVADGVPEGRSGANGGCGNYVEVDYGEIIVRFLHLYAGSIKVSTGDSVTYGQVIGKIGHNGDSWAPHSHTDYQDKTGKFLDPVDIVDPNDPRPVSKVYVTEGDYIVHTEKSSSEIVIKDVSTLKKAFKGRDKLVENAQAFLDMQSKYKVNAVFAAAVSVSETSAGTAGNAVNGQHNWFNIRALSGSFKTYSSDQEGIDEFGWTIAEGSYYFKNNKFKVSEIGPVYCPNDDSHPTQAEDWVKTTAEYMSDFYSNAGISISSGTNSMGGAYKETNVDGNGVKGTYESNGRKFKIYYQCFFSSYSDSYWNGTIGSDGCGPTSCAIILTGYGFDVSPRTLIKEHRPNGIPAEHAAYFTDRGLKATFNASVSESTIKKHLKSGGTIFVNVHGPLGSGNYYGGHFITFLGINSKGQIFVGDPGRTGNDGWYTWSQLSKANVSNCLFISK